jgi:hypothetical protein
MPLTLNAIRKKAANNSLEVEHLLKAAASRLEGLPALIEELTISENWSETGKAPDGSLIVPFAKWGRIASAYCLDEYAGLEPFACSPDCISFVLSMVQEVHESDGVIAITTWFQDIIANPAHDLQMAHQIAGALNLMLCFPPQVFLPDSVTAIIREFAHQLAQTSSEDSRRAIPILLLRSVGDSKSLLLISSLPALASPWHGVIATTSRAIKKRLLLRG